MVKEYNIELFADYFQFYLEDEGSQPDTSDIWNEEHVNQLLAVYPGMIAVGTARNMTVPVRIVLREDKPFLETDKYDKINECSIKTDTGKIVVLGCTDDYSDALRLNVRPGVYRARIHYAGLDTLSENGLEGEDRYEVILWPDTEERPIEKIK
jgi:hypothetical protein